MNNQTLNNGTVLFFSLLMIAVLVSLIGSRHYRASNRQVAVTMQQSDYYSYGSLFAMLRSGDARQDYLLVDLRDREVFDRGHIQGALNIPLQELTGRKHRKVLRANKTILLYSDSEHLSIAAKAVLLGKGAENVRVIPGGFTTIRSHAVDRFDPVRAHYNEDKARWDYQRFMPVGQPSASGRAAPSPDESTDSLKEAVPGGC